MPRKVGSTNGVVKAKHKRFIYEYLSNGYDIAKAYHVVYPDCREDLCYKKGRLLFKHPDVQEALDDYERQIYNELRLNHIRINSRIAQFAFDDNKSDDIALKACHQLSKNLGLEKQNINAKVDETIVISIEGEDDEEYNS